ncbi:MAG: Outer membrane protein assembly factor BamD [Verrucomicrobiae bacterium]|nr:Outer membrane protein assembly factor BamD [Verrucomicrobiae bacterium]
MKLLLFLCATVFVFASSSPAALIWRKGEGWSFERASAANANNPKEMLAIAQKFQADKQYDDAVAAYRRLITKWPTSFAAQDARLGLAESLTDLGYLFKAFKEYQNLIEKHPNSPHFETVLKRQFAIGERFLNGEKLKFWRIRVFKGYDKAVTIFEQVVKNGPYSEVGAAAQFNIGLTYEKQRDNVSAVHAYEKVLERYPKSPFAEVAQFQIGWAYQVEAQRADYDQNNANQAISAFSDFLVKYPASPKAEQAYDLRTKLRGEQSKGLLQIGAFYEKNKNYKAAVIYYNEVIGQNPRSDWANQAQQKLALVSPLAKEQAASK